MFKKYSSIDDFLSVNPNRKATITIERIQPANDYNFSAVIDSYGNNHKRTGRRVTISPNDIYFGIAGKKGYKLYKRGIPKDPKNLEDSQEYVSNLIHLIGGIAGLKEEFGLNGEHNKYDVRTNPFNGKDDVNVLMYNGNAAPEFEFYLNSYGALWLPKDNEPKTFLDSKLNIYPQCSFLLKLP